MNDNDVVEGLTEDKRCWGFYLQRGSNAPLPELLHNSRKLKERGLFQTCSNIIQLKGIVCRHLLLKPVIGIE